MIESIYDFIGLLGFHHPLHPLIVHIPMGMVIGALVFSLACFKWPDRHFDRTAYHCWVLALITVVPSYIIGFLDWQHVFGGDWLIWIVIKMILGVVLTLVLVFGVFLKRRGASEKTMLVLYFIAFALCGGLGFSGGQLVWGG